MYSLEKYSQSDSVKKRSKARLIRLPLGILLSPLK